MAHSIRPYKSSDLPALLKLGRAMHEEAPHYRHLPFSEAKAIEAIDRTAAFGAVFVATDGENTIGMIGGLVSEHFFTEYKTAYAICHYVDKEHRGSSAGVKLVINFEDWAFKSAQANATVLSPSTGINTDVVVSIYERMGYRMISHSLMKENPNV